MYTASWSEQTEETVIPAKTWLREGEEREKKSLGLFFCADYVYRYNQQAGRQAHASFVIEKAISPVAPRFYDILSPTSLKREKRENQLRKGANPSLFYCNRKEEPTGEKPYSDYWVDQPSDIRSFIVGLNLWRAIDGPLRKFCPQDVRKYLSEYFGLTFRYILFINSLQAISKMSHETVGATCE